MPFLRSSTRAFIREGRRTPGYSLFDLLHGYVYAAWPYLYIGIGTGEHRLTRFLRPLAAWLERRSLLKLGTGDAPAALAAAEPRTFADTYHGKVVTLQSATQLVSVKQEISLLDLEHIVPYPIARDIILKNPDHIVALECPCRAARANPCLPLDVCLIIGEPFASFVAEHHGRRARWVAAGEAAEILRDEHGRGHVHHAFFKDAMLGRFYAICNCCACCCGAMQAQRNGVPMLASSGYVAQVDSDRCAACGECAAHCQFGAIRVNGAAAGSAASAHVDRPACMGCGVCVSSCPAGAISLGRDPARPAPLEIEQLLAEALG
jgi:ferredoxin